MNFTAIVENGKISLGNDNNRERVRQWCLKNEGARVELRPILPESGKQRRYFEGAIVPLVCFFQEEIDHHDGEDLRKVREWLKLEFNGEIIDIGGKANKVARSTKGRALNAFVERVIDWVVEQYAPPLEALEPEKWKRWRDEVYSLPGSPDTYIDYLVEIGLLKK
jgi:hypothetical protein